MSWLLPIVLSPAPSVSDVGSNFRGEKKIGPVVSDVGVKRSCCYYLLSPAVTLQGRDHPRHLASLPKHAECTRRARRSEGRVAVPAPGH